VSTPENSNTASPSAAAGAGVDWQSRYLAGDTPWDKGAPHPALLDFLEKTPLRGRVLVPGCGSGHDVRAIAAQGNCQVVGIDLAPAALERAGSHAKAGSEIYILGDFLSGAAIEAGSFDCVFEHTCFCAIPPSRRRDYASAAASALRPGGLLVGVFFLNPDNPDPHSPPFRAELDEILGYFRHAFELEHVFQSPPTYAERAGREALLVFRRRAVE
jgi:SAM-dependent methyltransferase